MVFDVAVSFILMMRAPPYGTLMGTLGAFSVYSRFLWGRTMAGRAPRLGFRSRDVAGDR